MSTVGQLIADARKRAGLTQGQVATYASAGARGNNKVTRSWLSLVEKGLIARPDRDKLTRVASIVELAPSELLAAAGYTTETQPRRERRVEDVIRELETLLRAQQSDAALVLAVHEQAASAGGGNAVDGETVRFVPDSDKRSHSYIAVRVAGDCLADDPETPIQPGHTVVVDLSESARPGDVVYALRDGEALIKKLVKREGHLYLEGARGRPSMRVDDATDIRGVVIEASYAVARRRRP